METSRTNRETAKPLQQSEGAARAGGTTMRFGSRAEHVAQFLRQGILKKEITAPLPGTRRWSQQLGVSRSTLDLALEVLANERLLKITPRGVELLDGTVPARGNPTHHRIRWLLANNPRPYAEHYMSAASWLQERMRLKGVRVSWETGAPNRLRDIAVSSAPPGELCILASLAPQIQRAFANAGRPALVLGEVADGVSLPFVNADFSGAVRHATFQLLREGCRHIEMIHVKSTAVGISLAKLALAQAIADWQTSPISVRVLETSLDRTNLKVTMRRLVAGTSRGTGCIVVAPVPVGMVVTAILQKGLQIPEQVRLAAIFHGEEAVQLYPPFLHYPWPMPALLKRISAMAEIFFSSGKLPIKGRIATTASHRLS